MVEDFDPKEDNQMVLAQPYDPTNLDQVTKAAAIFGQRMFKDPSMEKILRDPDRYESFLKKIVENGDIL